MTTIYVLPNVIPYAMHFEPVKAKLLPGIKKLQAHGALHGALHNYWNVWFSSYNMHGMKPWIMNRIITN
eukprot:280681-Karenia_brevis.AAC.1